MEEGTRYLTKTLPVGDKSIEKGHVVVIMSIIYAITILTTVAIIVVTAAVFVASILSKVLHNCMCGIHDRFCW